MRLAVFGAGYVGLVAAACFADQGAEVTCVERDPRRLLALRGGRVPLVEPGLQALVTQGIAAERLRFTDDGAAAVRGAETVVIAVGTPSLPDGRADLGQVMEVAAAIGAHADGPRTVVLKSTVPVGTTERVAAEIRRRTSHPVSVLVNPEFLREGRAVEDFRRPARIVIGGDGGEAVARRLYPAQIAAGAPVLAMDPRSAEITKQACNAALAARISLMNLLAQLCERAGADIEEVRRGLGSDPRIGPDFLAAGVGWGGSCLPKDVAALTRSMTDHGVDAGLLTAIADINRRQRRWPNDVLRRRLGALDGRIVAVWGVAFKPGTDDLREAPSRDVVAALVDGGATVRAHDVAVPISEIEALGGGVVACASPWEAARGADALVILTEWPVYAAADPARLREVMRGRLVVDGRNVFEPRSMAAAGLEHVGVGRGAGEQGDRGPAGRDPTG